MRRFTIAVAALFSLAPAVLSAACLGTDLRPTLTPGEEAQVAAYVEQSPYGEGNHWIARRGSDVVHLVGTLHLDDPRLDAPTDRLRPIVESAAALLLESTAEEEEKLKELLATDPSVIVLDGPTLPERLEPEVWAALAEAASARGVPGFMAAKFQPWYLAIVLAAPPCAKELLTNKNGLDARLQKMAIDADVPRGALEPFDSVFTTFSQAPFDEQLEMLQASIVPPETSEDLLTTLLNGYFAETHAESWEVSRLLSLRMSPLGPEVADKAYAEMRDVLLDRRNRAWIPVIEAALAPPHIVVAMGGAHLHGEVGVLNLLAERGFVLERAPF